MMVDAAPRLPKRPIKNVRRSIGAPLVCSGAPMRENWISNRIFAAYSDILDHCCAAWNKLTDRPWLIMSIGLRDWAHRF